jgi:hypothetical protein
VYKASPLMSTDCSYSPPYFKSPQNFPGKAPDPSPSPLVPSDTRLMSFAVGKELAKIG